MNFGNPFNKPPISKIFGNGTPAPETTPDAGSHEAEKSLLKKLTLLGTFLAMMSSAEASSPALREFSDFQEMQSKSKTEFVNLQNKMHEMGSDTVRYEAAGKKMTFISHNGSSTYIEEGGGNKIVLEDKNGDHVVDAILMEGYIDGAVGIKDNNAPKIAEKPVDLKRISVDHHFSKDINSLSQVKVSSTISLTAQEEVRVFVKAQEKFVKGASDAAQHLENEGQSLAQK